MSITLKCLNLNSVNFEAKNQNGRTIFQACFNLYLANSTNDNLPSLKLRLESVFLTILDNAAANLDPDALKFILEKADGTGRTVAYQASQFSEKILSKLCEHNVSMNQITANFEVIELNFPALTSTMIKLGVNPRIVDLFGQSQYQLLMKNFPNDIQLMERCLKNAKSVYFSMEDENCDENCSNPCKSALTRYIVHKGIFIDPDKANCVGVGSSGGVFAGIWHSEYAAFKFIRIQKYKSQSESIKSLSDLQENISEFINQRSIQGPGVLKPIGFYRQQILKRKKIEHFNVIIYPLCDCNLYELLESNSFTDDQVAEILNQCLIRRV